MDPSTLVAAGPSNIPPPVINPTPSERRQPNNNRSRRPKRKRIASEASTSVAGEHVEGDGDRANVPPEVWSSPWLEGLGTTKYESKEQRLHDEIVAFFSYISPTPDEKHARAMVISQISEVASRRFDRASVETFGSVAQNLYLPDGDTDLVINTPKPLNDDLKKRSLFQLAALMRTTYITPHVQVIHRARVPVISFTTQPDLGLLKIDISFNSTDGVKAVPILRDYFDKIPALRFLVLCIKSLLSRHHLNTASSSGLSSYGVICLAINFLQLNPMERPTSYIEQPMENEALGILLMDFLNYYGNKFKYNTSVVSVREAKLLSKADKGWDNPNQPESLCIECILNPENDVGRPTSKIGKIRQVFKDAYTQLKQYPFSDAPLSFNILGAALGVSESTLAHRALLRDIVTSGRLTQALRNVQMASVSMSNGGGGSRRPQYIPQLYHRNNPQPYSNYPGNDRPRDAPPRPAPPPPTSLPPKPRTPYVPQGPSFGALKAAAAASANSTSNTNGGSKPKPPSNKSSNTNSSQGSSQGTRSPPRRRRKPN